MEDCPVRLEALYEGKDPWTDLDGYVSSSFEAFTPAEDKNFSIPELNALILAKIKMPDGG